LGPEKSGLLPLVGELDWLSLGHGHIECELGVMMWLGPALTKLLVLGACGCVVSLRVARVSGKWWFRVRCSCPYFENCIVDASISL
jgi:hypothetical protein